MHETDFIKPRYTTDNLTSLQSHILSEEQRHPGATGEFSWILSAISLAGKSIANKVRRARIEDMEGPLCERNVHGEQQLKMDVIANELIMRCLGDRENVAVLASEEGEEPVVLRSRAAGGRYCVLFDPLDGSSNLDASVGVGTIFSILRNERRLPREVPHYVQPGIRQVAAGYILYGSSVVLVLTTGNGVAMFVLDYSLGAFVLVKKDIRIPPAHREYSINEAYVNHFPQGYRDYLEWAHSNSYSSRYIGSMVADVHRSLLHGGVFMYPPTGKHAKGKLRLLYEANPMAMIIEQAGGKAFADRQRILDIRPTDLHQRTSVIIGSPEEVDHVLRHLEAADRSSQGLERPQDAGAEPELGARVP